MKNILKYSIFSLLFVSAISCSDDDQTIATPVGGPVLIAPAAGTNIVLNEGQPNNPAVTFVWNHADYDVATAVNYQIEVAGVVADVTGAFNPAGPSTTNRFLTLTVQELNDAAIGAGLEPFVAGELEVRVIATLGDNDAMPMVSNTVSINVTPYTAILPQLFMVGAVQGGYGLNEWDNTTAMAMRYIGDGTTKVFEAYVRVSPGQGFKFIGEQGTWDNGNFGTIGGAQDGNMHNDGGSGDIKVAETDGEGLYYVWVDIDNLKYKSSKMDWGIIGSATPGAWDNETPMVYDYSTNSFSLSTTLTAGEMKFRAANAGNAIYSEAWKFNVGVSDPTVVYNAGASNFNVPAGPVTLGLTVGFDGSATVTGL